MRTRIGVWLCQRFIIWLVSVTSIGCASLKMDPAFMVAQRHAGRVTITRYVGLHQSPGNTNALNYRCIEAIEKILLSGRDLPYVERSDVGLWGPGPDESDKTKTTEYYQELKTKNGVTAFITVRLGFAVGVGWNKPMKLYILWMVFSSEGQKQVEIETEATSNAGEEVFPDTRDPRYEGTFVELATRNAEQFLGKIEYLFASQLGPPENEGAAAIAHNTSSHAGEPVAEVMRYTAAGGTVYDAKSKLTWQQTVSSSTYPWLDAKTYCAGVSLGGGGWRLPTVEELKTIVDKSRANPAIDSTAFPSTPADRFWSSSPFSPSHAWAVYFDSGQAYSFDVSMAGNVRCVR
jgi:hypothetical protein